MAEGDDHDERPRISLTLEGVAALAAILISLISGMGVLYVALYRVDKLEKAHDAHVTDSKTVAEKAEARIDVILSQVREVDARDDKRISLLDDRFATLIEGQRRSEAKLDELKTKLDDLAQHRR